jgi:4-hydroxy-4-methyl-2-oxoglutarate aldolase
VVVRPGDIVLGDDDGVVVVAREKAEAVLASARQRTEQEAGVMQRLEAGELTLDILGFRKALEQHGIQI